MERKTKKTIPKILAVECSGKVFSAALFADGVLKAETSFDVGLKHSLFIKDACDFILKKSGCAKEELTHIAVTTGPGSFTGLRVGISFVKTAAQLLKIGVIGIPTFEVIASGIHKRFEFPSAILIDSIGSEFFAGFFEAGKLVPNGHYQIFTLEKLIRRVKKPMLFAGNGFLHYETDIKNNLGNNVIPVSQAENFPSARNLAELAWCNIQQSRRTDNWKSLNPFYLREPLAVERLKGLKT